jgi:hypothetical protein
MLGLVAGVEPFLMRQADRWSHTIVQDWRDTGRAAAREAPSCDLLCFGSSMIKFGVLPAAFEAGAGRRGYNLALLNGPPPASCFLLERALGRGARPSVVVVDFDHKRLEADPRSDHFNYPWADLLGPVEAFDLARRAGDPTLFARVALASALPSVRRRHEIRAAVVARFQGYAASLNDLGAAFGSKPAFTRNRRVNRGAVVNAPVVEDRRPPLPEPEEEGARPWLCHPVNAHYLKRFLALCSGRKIAVLWLLPPVSPNHQAVYYRVGARERYLDLVRRLAGRYPGVVVVDGRNAGYPNSVYIDHVHLDRTGALFLSRSLASIIGRGQIGTRTRWVGLAPFREETRADEVEDLGRSELVVKAASEEARR